MNKGPIEFLRRTALLVLALVGCSVSQAASLALYFERVHNAVPDFPGCSASVCAQGQDPLAPETVQFNQQWNTANGSFFMDGEAQTTGSGLTGPPTASARMRTNISGRAEASIYYQFQLTCAPGANCGVITPDFTIPIGVLAFGSVQVRPDPTADNGAYLGANVYLDISNAGISVLSGSVVVECFYVGGVCDTSFFPHSFAVVSTMTMTLLQTTSISMYAAASVSPPLNSPGRGAGEVIATVDPVFYIDPEFRINGVLATNLLRLEFSPNLAQVPLPATGLLFPAAMAAALGRSRRKRRTDTGA